MKPVVFWLTALLLAGLTWTATLLGAQWGWFVMPAGAVIVIAAVAVACGAVYQAVAYRQRHRPDTLANFLLLTIVLKFFFFALFAGVLVWVDKPHAGANAVLFLATYFVFTPFLVVALYKRF